MIRINLASTTAERGAGKPPNFRCTGRDRWWTPLRYAWDEFITLNLGRL